MHRWTRKLLGISTRVSLMTELNLGWTKRIMPGQHWEHEVRQAIKRSDLVVVCLSRAAVNKVGFVQKEIKLALDVADEQPEGRVFIIPAKLEECDVPERLKRWHWVNLFVDEGYGKLWRTLETRAASLSGLKDGGT